MQGHDHQDDSPLDPAGMLALSDRASAEAARSLRPDERLIYAAWGVAWTTGFALRWLATRDDPIVSEAGADLTANGLMVAALVLTATHIGRRVAGIGGRSAAVGRRFSALWVVAFCAYGLIMAGLGRGDAPDDLVSVVAATLPVLLVGLIYAAGGTAWDDDLMFGLGLWLAALAGVAAFVGDPGHLVLLAVGGGGGFIVAAALAARVR